jgi:hypothetical protein
MVSFRRIGFRRKALKQPGAPAMSRAFRRPQPPLEEAEGEPHGEGRSEVTYDHQSKVER